MTTIVPIQRRNWCVRTWTLVLFSSIVPAIVTIYGCSSSSTSAPDEKQAPSVVAAAFCGALKDCCTAANFAYDDAACISQVETHTGFLWSGGQGTAYNGDAVAGCADALKALETKCVADESVVYDEVNYGDPAVFACQQVHNGTKSPGEPCQEDWECAWTPSAAAYCDAYPSKEAKICQLRTFGAKIGSPCGELEPYDHTLCDYGGYCVKSGPAGTTSAAGTCKPLPQLGPPGAACSSWQDCDSSSCDDIKKVCKPRSAVGEKCDSSANCVAGAYCGQPPNEASQAAICQPLKEIGAACEDGGQCKSGYCYPFVSTDPNNTPKCAAFFPEFVVSQQAWSQGPPMQPFHY